MKMISASFKSLLILFILTEIYPRGDCSSPEAEDAASMVGLLTTGFQPKEWKSVKHQTSLGVIEGRTEKSVGHQSLVEHYYAFRGIPYAHAPVGDLRFADPIDATSTWPDTYLDATRLGSVCSQFNTVSQEVVGAEDCLFLNIFTPALPGTDSEVSDGLPVFVFIHGGGYIRGSSSAHPGGRLASQNILVVTINYRLGVLGFLSTEDKVIPGNFGMLDQVSALRWVQRNIGQFGGDPNKVTVGGFSAGSASSHQHMLSPLSKGLFRSVVLTSGSGNCQWATIRTPQQDKEILAKKLKCPYKSSKDLKTCLASKTQKELLRAQAAVLRYEYWPVPFAPTIDADFRKNPFLPAPIAKLSPPSMPVLIGLVPQEGIVFALGGILTSDEPTNTKATYDQVVRDLVSSLWYRPDKAEVVGQAVETFYYTQRAKDSANVLFEELSETLTDCLFHSCMSDAAARLAINGNSVYTYLFTHRDPESPIWSAPVYKEAKSLGITSSLLDTGVSHGDNLEFIFSQSTFDRARDEEVAHFIASNLVHFVTNGSPAVPKEEWPPLEPGGPVLFYNISSNSHMQRTPFKAKEANFWLQTIPFVEAKSTAKKEGQNYMSWIVGAIMTYIVISLASRNR